MSRKPDRAGKRQNVVTRTLRSSDRREGWSNSGPQALTMDELKRLLDALSRKGNKNGKGNKKGERDYLMALLAVRHGMRASEVCDLQWSDIDLKGGTITIRRLKGSTTQANLLAPDEKKALQKLPRVGAHVFLNPQGKQFNRMVFARIIERAGAKAGLPFRCGPHRLKHTCGTYHANAGKLTPMQIQRLMGHKDFRSTQIYIDMAPVPLDKTFMPV